MIMESFGMDGINIKLIERMQQNADLSLLELSKSVGISKTACWNRLQRMEEEKKKICPMGQRNFP